MVTKYHSHFISIALYLNLFFVIANDKLSL
jgi:hypothetical protein